MRRLRPVLVDAGLIAVAAVDADLAHLTPAVALGAAAAALVVIPLRRWWPIAVFVVSLPALAIAGSVVATLIALYTVARQHRDRRLLAACGVLAAAGYAFPGWGAQFSRSDLATTVLYAVMTAAAPILLGTLVRTRRELSLRLQEIERVREHERELDAQVVLAKERNQLAREMHDVVSHQVSLIAVQAGALGVSTADPAAREVAETVRRLSVDTLDELRHMVTLLRGSGDPAAGPAPQPALSGLDRLIATSGITVRLTGSAPAGLGPAHQRTIYRTVQEALTNVRKHAPGGHADVEISHDGVELTVSVGNTPATRPAPALPGSGLGLTGLGERAALLGGTVEAGPLPGGGFRLCLRLPLGGRGPHS
ncbi:histidine kinase [Amycolatopsis sp. PS_44_ISF1]|uniref:sensor histidine kinase n=1 Tax=Amycolatopsis sp. PS_44_ISF1 TaxID=2974917 RepID=UPI0028DEC1F9|nr:histidine kinase [Amycolatopsis sp. PS_44_ISF1]MDT8912443.1 histidine kinase [Amycolatopsis sp. PS_44_ISF1]